MGWIRPVVPALPMNATILVTTREQGYSQGVYGNNNLALHVGDDPILVGKNRAKLYAELGAQITWLKQVHGNNVVNIETIGDATEADGCFTHSRHVVCAVLTADCLPILVCDRYGREAAALHAGWRGLANGVITRGVSRFSSNSSELVVYLGPAISQSHFEVGEEVLHAFQQAQSERSYFWSIEDFFKPSSAGKFYASLVGLATSELRGLGINEIYGGDLCTVNHNHLFYSYRKEQRTGRFASVIRLT